MLLWIAFPRFWDKTWTFWFHLNSLMGLVNRCWISQMTQIQRVVPDACCHQMWRKEKPDLYFMSLQMASTLATALIMCLLSCLGREQNKQKTFTLIFFGRAFHVTPGPLMCWVGFITSESVTPIKSWLCNFCVKFRMRFEVWGPLRRRPVGWSTANCIDRLCHQIKLLATWWSLNPLQPQNFMRFYRATLLCVSVRV